MAKRHNHPEPGLWHKLVPAVKQMRREPTPAEKALWVKLRDSQVGGLKFRRQHAIDRFVVDFFCPEAGLIVEVDGPVHLAQVEEDQERQELLTQMGFRFLRFTNDQVLRQIDNVLAKIREAVEDKGSLHNQ